ncbi:hypothetical protein TSO5_03565 [Azospirillum sp. TSO5]|nr:hypothetical protein TSO5_03565 [Azospirillum sp. TSO5]
MRGTLDVAGMPGGLLWALRKYDDLRAGGNYEQADAESRRPPTEIGEHLTRLHRGMMRLTYRSVLAVARRHSGVCPVYVRQHLGTLSSLMGLFYWNDGTGETRRRLLLLAWRKGAHPPSGKESAP